MAWWRRDKKVTAVTPSVKPHVPVAIPSPAVVKVLLDAPSDRVDACLNDIASKLLDADWVNKNRNLSICSCIALNDGEVDIVLRELRAAGWVVAWEYGRAAERHFFTLSVPTA